MLVVQNPALDDTVCLSVGPWRAEGQVSPGWMLFSLLPFSVPTILTPPFPPAHTLTAGRTGEAGVVVEVPHGLAGLAGPKHPFAALHTGSCKGKNTAVNREGMVETES